ncbi:LD-carboxypeptidase [Sporolactobacillus sp. CQH2019]|uniref:S66 peptidase family protein n=1 Tax=Sporolactobacillus sp. CQH2019 TaxID=3023512 RepID=UPI0023677681|nr:LD-carboxypeptidase [Sporolactobacillus sp. CQH2019]MDD9150372.1 LD-carboxypeptidase [Sporolactobacillus sp. CQH2019]
MTLLQKGDSVGLISCSDGLFPEERAKIEKIERVLGAAGLQTRRAHTLFRRTGTPFSGTPEERASELMRLFSDNAIRAIFDVSGGDSANQILPYLDFARIRRADTPFVGISDLSVINNAVFACSGAAAWHYRIKNLAGPFAEQQKRIFRETFLASAPSPAFDYHWLRGSGMAGVTIGGNIRCFLKLAGTDYFPDPAGKIIFLEALGGGPARIASLLAQLDQLSVFRSCAGVLLGTFTAMEAGKQTPAIERLVLGITEKYGLPVAKTEQLGHGEDARCLPIGKMISL